MDGFDQIYNNIKDLLGESFSVLKFAFPPLIPFVSQYEQLAGLFQPPAQKLPEPMPPETGAPETTMSFEEFLKQAQRVGYEANLYAQKALETETEPGEVILLPKPELKEQYAMENIPQVEQLSKLLPTGKIELPIPQIQLPEIKLPELPQIKLPDLSSLGAGLEKAGWFIIIALFLVLLVVVMKR
jgi:hypothetical protein